jgi:hypothetical protein
MARNTMDIKATSTSGRGEFAGLPNDTDMAIPVVATAQLVVASRRVRQTLLRYISPRYRWANMPSSAAVYGLSDPGFLFVLMALPPVTNELRFRVR